MFLQKNWELKLRASEIECAVEKTAFFETELQQVTLIAHKTCVRLIRQLFTRICTSSETMTPNQWALCYMH